MILAMTWNNSVIRDHKEAAARLTAITRDAFQYLRDQPRATEGETKDFILREFRRHGLVMDKPFTTPIVAFGSHAADPHYHPVPGARRLAPGTLVMIDVWGRLRGRHKPYADITWMGYRGGGAESRGRRLRGRRKVSREFQNVFDAVLAARDACLKLVRRGALPVGKTADEAANKILRRRGYGRFIRHSTGHVLGFASPHGRGRNINRKNKYPLLKNIGYTIEPGIYMKGKLGARSEMNFYVSSAGKVIVTTPLQRRLVMI